MKSASSDSPLIEFSFHCIDRRLGERLLPFALSKFTTMLPVCLGSIVSVKSPFGSRARFSRFSSLSDQRIMATRSPTMPIDTTINAKGFHATSNYPYSFRLDSVNRYSWFSPSWFQPPGNYFQPRDTLLMNLWISIKLTWVCAKAEVCGHCSIGARNWPLAICSPCLH